MLTAVGALGKGAPYKTVLTHGWVVDGEGKAMHKSLGNSIAPDEMIKKYGADIVRLWVASSDYRVDVRVSDKIFGQLAETYRKIRNTSRILMANLGDFNPDTDMVPVDELYDIDKWIISCANDLANTVIKAYNDYEFHIVYHGINNFCTTNLSKLYIDITKDRVYVEKKDGKARRSAQTAMYMVLSALTRLIAPMIVFTSEEIWKAMPHLSNDNVDSIFLNDMPKYDEKLTFPEIRAKWDQLFEHRDAVMKALEIARAEKLIGKSLDAKVKIYTNNDEIYELLSGFESELATVYIVSQAELVKGDAPEGAYSEEGAEISVLVSGADGHKCDRCWAYSENGVETDGGFLCERCRAIIEG